MNCVARYMKMIFVLPFIFLCSACSDVDISTTIIPENVRAVILSEGTFPDVPGSITLLTRDNLVIQDVFQKINKRPIGSVPQSLKKIGLNYYIPVNNSGKIEVIDAENFESVETMTLDFNVIPMFVEHLGGDSIVLTDQTETNHQSSLTIMDINHGMNRDYVRRRIILDNPTFDVKLVGKKLFVVSESLLVFDLDNISKDSMRQVIDIDGNTFKIPDFSVINIDKNEMLWVLALDGIKCINPNTEKVVKEFPLKNVTDRIDRLVIDNAGENIYTIVGNSIFALNINDQNISEKPIFTHNQNDAGWTTYGFNISNENTIFISKVVFGYVTRSSVYEYDLEGNIVSRYKNDDGEEENFFKAGVWTSTFYFLDEN